MFALRMPAPTTTTPSNSDSSRSTSSVNHCSLLLPARPARRPALASAWRTALGRRIQIGVRQRICLSATSACSAAMRVGNVERVAVLEGHPARNGTLLRRRLRGCPRAPRGRNRSGRHRSALGEHIGAAGVSRPTVAALGRDRRSHHAIEEIAVMATERTVPGYSDNCSCSSSDVSRSRSLVVSSSTSRLDGRGEGRRQHQAAALAAGTARRPACCGSG